MVANYKTYGLIKVLHWRRKDKKILSIGKKSICGKLLGFNCFIHYLLICRQFSVKLEQVTGKKVLYLKSCSTYI
jgi:hypothetical protein